VNRIRTGALCCLCIVLGALAGAATAAELPDGFRLEPVVTGLTQPSDVAVAPDGRILITERTTGNLLQVKMGELDPAPLCHVSVETAGEAGLLGVAVHPDFVRNGWIYLYYTDVTSGSNRVTRYTVQGDACGAPLTLLDLGAGRRLRDAIARAAAVITDQLRRPPTARLATYRRALAIVRRGDVIAKAGNTGQVDQPQLHFELRQGSKPVDPLPYLDRL